MKNLQLSACIIISFIVGFIILASNSQDPLKSKYLDTIELFMDNENLKSEEQVLQRFQYLQTVKALMEKASCLKNQVRFATEGPAPRIGINEEASIKAMQVKINYLRNEAAQLLAQPPIEQTLVSAY